MKTLVIVGHKNPDTDSVVSAFVLSKFFKKTAKVFPWFKDFNSKSAVAGALNKETKFVFNYFRVTPPSQIKSIKNKNVFLVDHNSYDQAVDGIRKANILGIIDHHNVEGFETSFPIFCCIEPIGSASTIIANIFLNNNISFDKKTAGLLLSAILSDTLKLTSPTTTTEDKKIAKILSKKSGENMNELSKKMFEAKSDLRGISAQKLVSQDYKEFKVKDINLGFGVLETVNPSQAENIKNKIFLAIKELKEKRKVNLIFFAVVDILKRNTIIFLLGEKEKLVAEKAFNTRAKGEFLFLPGVVSRKKQIIPLLKKFLSK